MGLVYVCPDDDALIIPDNLQRGLMDLDDSAKEEIAVWGYLGCSSSECEGICGGGGYFMNRKTLVELNEGGDRLKYPTFRDEIDMYHYVCKRCGDLALVEALLNARNIPTNNFFEGNYIWGFKSDEKLFETLADSAPHLPWLYHYGAKGRFPFVWQKVKEFGSSKDLDD